jgi:hypothetical protein
MVVNCGNNLTIIRFLGVATARGNVGDAWLACHKRLETKHTPCLVTKACFIFEVFENILGGLNMIGRTC